MIREQVDRRARPVWQRLRMPSAKREGVGDANYDGYGQKSDRETCSCP